MELGDQGGFGNSNLVSVKYLTDRIEVEDNGHRYPTGEEAMSFLWVVMLLESWSGGNIGGDDRIDDLLLSINHNHNSRIIRTRKVGWAQISQLC